MEYGMFIMKTRKRQITKRIELPNQKRNRTLREKKTYKYLRIFEKDMIKHAEMKENIRNKYLSRTRNLLKRKL